jgi:glycerate 2-kinase
VLLALAAVEMAATYPGLTEAINRAQGARRDALLAVRAALNAADPRKLVDRAITRDGRILTAGGRRYDLDAYHKVVVLGGGKASGLMAAEVEGILGDSIDEGVVIVPDTQKGLPELRRVRFAESSHPLPTEEGVHAVERMLEVVDRIGSGDLAVFLFSGGGSSLMPFPAAGVSLEDLRDTTGLLLKSGADIVEMNCVRKHLSRLSGGRLAERVHGADVLSLVVSDVVGDDLGSVASGPTVPDSTTFTMAKEVMERHGVWGSVPPSVRRTIQAGISGALTESPKPGDPLFAKVNNILIGSNKIACAAAKASLEGAGYQVRFFLESVTGEARDVGRRLVDLTRSGTGNGTWALIAGGETTVTVKGPGRGGRNQELVLSAAMALRGTSRTTLLSFATDGIDGMTDAAGAIADSTTYERARSNMLDPAQFLDANDSHTFFEALGDLVVTGPTGTNVNDVTLLLKW